MSEQGEVILQAVLVGGPLDGTVLNVRPDRPQVIAMPAEGGGYVRSDDVLMDGALFVWQPVPTAKPGMSGRTLRWGCALGGLFWLLVALAFALWPR